jgi:hypothetical protein
LDHCADPWPGRVALAAVAAGIAHTLDLGFVQVRELVLIGLRAEAQLVDVLDHVAQVVARQRRVVVELAVGGSFSYSPPTRTWPGSCADAGCAAYTQDVHSVDTMQERAFSPPPDPP